MQPLHGKHYDLVRSAAENLSASMLGNIPSQFTVIALCDSGDAFWMSFFHRLAWTAQEYVGRHRPL